MKKLVAAAFAAFSLALAGTALQPAQAQSFTTKDASHLVFNVGYYDVVQDDDTATSFGVEYRDGNTFLGIFKPMVASFVTTDGSFWLGAGVAVDFYLGENVVLTGSFAPGYYAEGDGKDLGYPLEFRSQLELGYRFEDYSRLTVGINHLSNSGIFDDDGNPGTEVVTVNYYLPLGNLMSMME